MQKQVHLAEKIRQRFRLATEDAFRLKSLAVGDGLHLLGKMIKRFDKKATRAACRIKHGFPKPRIGDLDHEANDGARRIKLTGVSSSIAHLTKHGFVKGAKGVKLVGRREVDASNLIDHVSKQIPTLHTVIDATKDRGNHVASVVTVGAR